MGNTRRKINRKSKKNKSKRKVISHKLKRDSTQFGGNPTKKENEISNANKFLNKFNINSLQKIYKYIYDTGEKERQQRARSRSPSRSPRRRVASKQASKQEIIKQILESYNKDSEYLIIVDDKSGTKKALLEREDNNIKKANRVYLDEYGPCHQFSHYRLDMNVKLPSKGLSLHGIPLNSQNPWMVEYDSDRVRDGEEKNYLSWIKMIKPFIRN